MIDNLRFVIRDVNGKDLRILQMCVNGEWKDVPLDLNE